jgi:hypothetical protein
MVSGEDLRSNIEQIPEPFMLGQPRLTHPEAQRSGPDTYGSEGWGFESSRAHDLRKRDFPMTYSVPSELILCPGLELRR